MQESIIFCIVRVRCRHKERVRSLSHLLMSSCFSSALIQHCTGCWSVISVTLYISSILIFWPMEDYCKQSYILYTNRRWFVNGDFSDSVIRLLSSEFCTRMCPSMCHCASALRMLLAFSRFRFIETRRQCCLYRPHAATEVAGHTGSLRRVVQGDSRYLTSKPLTELWRLLGRYLTNVCAFDCHFCMTIWFILHCMVTTALEITVVCNFFPNITLIFCFPVILLHLQLWLALKNGLAKLNFTL